MKVKNIMFSGFAAAILMGVAAEANAASTAKVVASKGYVDAVAGPLVDLSTEAKDNLVKAINEVNANKQAKFTDGDDVSTTIGFISSVTQTGGAVTAGVTTFDTAINDQTKEHQNTAPTTKAVADAIAASVNTYNNGTDINIGADNSVNATYASLQYDSGTDAVDNADKLDEGYAVSYVKQQDGEVKIGAKPYAAEITEGEVMAPTTAAVYTAIQGVSDQITDLDLAAVGGDGQYVMMVKQDNGQLTATAGSIDTAMSANSANPVTNSAITAALAGKQDTLNLGANLSYDEDGNLTATDTTYQGEGYITVANGKISTTLQAGENITIDNDGKINTSFPEMPRACAGDGVVCVLTSEGGEFAWAVLTKPFEAGDATVGNAAQVQTIPGNIPVIEQQ